MAMMDHKLSPSAGYGRSTDHTDVAIIGAGISGLCVAIDMIRRGNGRNFVIIEKGSQVGGTWNDNVYPGCCCDVWGHLYSYSFEPNANWTRQYPSQQEIQQYLIHVAHKYKLYQHIRFNSSVEEARWDENSCQWRVQVRRHGAAETGQSASYTIRSSFLVSAVGQLSIPKYPVLPGASDFGGKIMHSARWDWDYDLRGKRVGVLGTGSTAAQIIPEIAPYCKRLVVFQRSPTWVLPRHDGPISPIWRLVYKYVPFVQKRLRASMMGIRESHFAAGFDAKSASHLFVSDKSRQHLQDQLKGEWNAELRCKLTPNYPFNCKRIVVSDDYYPAFTRENVELEVNPISNLEGKGARMQNGKFQELDLLVLATGFQTTRFVYPIRIFGRDGVSLEQAWSNGATAYLGITTNDLPNFGMLYGPNTNLAYNSLILQIESQSRYVNTLIAAVLGARRKGQSLRLEPRADVVRAYNDEIQARLGQSIFADPRCSSWFKTETGRITNNWCDSAIEYQKRTSFVEWKDFDMGGTAAPEMRLKRRTTWKRVVEERQPHAWVLELLTVLLGGALLVVTCGYYYKSFT